MDLTGSVNQKPMPSIEIVAIEQSQPSDFHDFPFAVKADRILRRIACPRGFSVISTTSPVFCVISAIRI